MKFKFLHSKAKTEAIIRMPTYIQHATQLILLHIHYFVSTIIFSLKVSEIWLFVSAPFPLQAFEVV